MEGAKALLDKQLLSKHLDDLRLCIRGKVITPTDEEYSKARSRPFNHDARGYPLVVVQVKSVEDVVVCIRFITTFARPGILCVASGAHSIRCMKSGAFVIDLQYLNQVTVDVEHRTAMMEGGALMHKLDEACAAHNLATTAGTYPNTGVGGLSLSGGYGWLARTFGYTVDNLIGAEVVLPDGRVVTASDDNEFADLLWGLRGGAGNFGVVTKFMFRLHVLPPTVMGGLMIHVTPSIEAKRALLRKFDHLIQTDPKGVTGAVVLIPAPVTPTLWVYIGDAKRFSDVPALVQAKGLAGWMTVSNTVKKRSYHKGVQQLLKPFQESGYRYDSIVPVATTDQPLTDRFIQDVLAHTSKPLHPHVKKASVVMFAMGGACCVAGDET
jgi:FAD/FMN-containing dehydrogenase